VVVSSNFTSALDVLGGLAERNAWGFLRLDGGTPTNARQSMVDRFNKAPPRDLFLFFLSAKAGGVGLNLVGANRIVLFDSDWNPATDDQAMARVWRLGQTKEVSMYRLLSTGTLEEKIYQRQIFKGALYDLIHESNDPSKEDGQGRRERRAGSDGGDSNPAAGAAKGPGAQSSRGFSQEELKELFVLKTGTKSDTFDKLRRGIPAAAASAAVAEMPTVGRSEQTAVEGEQRESSRGEVGVVGAAAETPDAADEAWEDYGGPSRVLDEALRHALLEGAAGAETAAGSAGGDGAGVVTFVREVKRGGEAGQQRRPSGGATGTVCRSPFAALEGGARGNSPK
ncbi:unnamed protein product, partial [Hapterophycus canaliculatus]